VIEKTSQAFKPKTNDVIVKVQYCGVNFIDTYYRKGLYPIESFPAIMGQEASGTIVGLPTDPTILDDPQYKKRGFEMGGKVAVKAMGVFAEYVAIPWKLVFSVPSTVSTLTAAAGLLQGFTAMTFMEESYNVQKGDTILIHTIAGGLGQLMCQLAKSRGATVIGTTSTKAKATLAIGLGADHVILYTEEDVVKRVLDITDGEGVHAVFDGVGKDTFDNNFKLIRRKGTIVSIGNASGPVPPFPPLKLAEKNVKLLRPNMNNYIVTAEEGFHYSAELFKLIADGTLKINVHKEYPFTAEGVAESQKDLTGGKTAGKLVIKIADE